MLRFTLLFVFELFLLCDTILSVSDSSDSSSSEQRFIDSLSDEEFSPAEEEGTIWAVLVAGSNGWYNYRHQADICHAWHMLVNHGVNPDNIITMMYDDVANAPQNPHRGKLYNNPHGKDVYAGVKIDYKGDDVNPQNFMSVLLGDSDAVEGKKVLKSTNKDKVFVNFVDHGGTGIIGFPTDVLSVKDLSQTLKGMHKKGLYRELTFYLEACESGSMFKWKMPNTMEIYAVTAANAQESSWACYCETKLLPNNCLGDCFSVNWMEDSDMENLRTETLSTQFGIVKRETNTSHVQEFGNLDIQGEDVAEFMGNKQTKQRMAPTVQQSAHDFAMYPARDLPLFMLAKEAQNDDGDDVNNNKMHILQKKRRYLERQITRLVRKVLHDPVNQRRALTTYPARITQMECHHQVVHTFNKFCFNFAKNPYALKYAYVLANLCEHRIQPERIQAIIMEHCADVDITDVL